MKSVLTRIQRIEKQISGPEKHYVIFQEHGVDVERRVVNGAYDVVINDDIGECEKETIKL